MPRFEVYGGDALIGWTDLESGDAPMGVALGRLVPSPAYAAFAASRTSEPPPVVTIRLTGGEYLTPHLVHIDDFSADLGPEGLQISALGISYPTYARLFPEHVRNYQLRIKDPSGGALP